MTTIIRAGEDRIERDDRATSVGWPRTFFMDCGMGRMFLGE
jgi:hypothetical protein